MGKLEEGTFSLDFHELSPFQVKAHVSSTNLCISFYIAIFSILFVFD